jgi:RNA polymerase sigma factor (sigma-70 family)
MRDLLDGACVYLRVFKNDSLSGKRWSTGLPKIVCAMSPTHESTQALPAPQCVAPPEDARDWFRREVHSHDDHLKNYLRASFPSVRDVEDIAQESYLKIWKAKAVPIRSTKAFLFRVARHLAIDTVRRQRSPVGSAEDLAPLAVLSPEPDAAQALVAKELLERLGDAIIALPSHYRAVIILHKIQGLPQKEVASQLGISAKSVEKYVQRGMAKIDEHLSSQGINGLSR